MSELPNSVTEPEADTAREAHRAEPMTFWQRWAEMLIAAIVIALGVIVLVETQSIREAGALSAVSPRAIPRLMGAALIVVGLWYAFDIIRNPTTGQGEESEDVDPEAKTDWSVIGIIGLGLICYALLMENAGFIVASAVLFSISAFAMGSRRYPRDISIAIVLSVAIFLLFDTWLGVRLPPGQLGEWISQEL